MAGSFKGILYHSHTISQSYYILYVLPSFFLIVFPSYYCCSFSYCISQLLLLYFLLLYFPVIIAVFSLIVFPSYYCCIFSYCISQLLLLYFLLLDPTAYSSFDTNNKRLLCCHMFLVITLCLSLHRHLIVILILVFVGLL